MGRSFEYLTDRDAAHIVSEVTNHPDHQCREHVILAQSPDRYVAGTVLKDNGSGEMIIHDGTGAATGILFGERDAADGPVRAVANVWGTSYKIPLVIFASGTSEADKQTVMAQMKTDMRLVGVTADNDSTAQG